MNRLGMAAWLADNDGIPYQCQHLFDLTEYEQQAQEIVDNLEHARKHIANLSAERREQLRKEWQ